MREFSSDELGMEEYELDQEDRKRQKINDAYEGKRAAIEREKKLEVYVVFKNAWAKQSALKLLMEQRNGYEDFFRYMESPGMDPKKENGIKLSFTKNITGVEEWLKKIFSQNDASPEVKPEHKIGIVEFYPVVNGIPVKESEEPDRLAA